MATPPKARKKHREVSLNTVADVAGTHRNMVAAVLRDDPDVDPEMRDRVMAAVEQTGYVPPPTNQHFNSALDQDKADKIVEGVILNKPLETICKETGLGHTTALKYVRGVKVPEDYPENEEDWRNDVTGFLKIAIWKGTKRLAQESVMLIDDRSLPIAVAVMADKLQMLSGQPTSFHVSLNSTVTHRDLVKEIETRDVTPGVSDEHVPEP
jgi:hypothetical protein